MIEVVFFDLFETLVTMFDPQLASAPLQDVVFSHDVGFAKPQPEIYLLACGRAGVAPQRAIFVGDGDNNELAGAEHVGMRAYWATWFLDQSPQIVRPASFYETVAPYPRLRVPADLLPIVAS